jgi:CubicO group peptidase (beta-lactamase class C family)
MTDLPAVLRDLVESERKRFDVPGCAVAVVKDGEVLLADGFGLRHLESQDPVGPDTLFPIASDTKCFTAALLCQLAAAGDLDLDAPVRDVLPWFRMTDDAATRMVSVRDLLAHRTGLPRHDLVWYGETDLTLERIARSLAHLPMSRQLRQTWQYNNLAYSTAGHVTEVLAGLPWQEAVRTRLLEPLGMSATGFSARDMADGDYAFPYSDGAGELVLQELPARSKLGPPGGIVSSARDLSQWLLARLGKRPEVLSEGALQQLHGPAMLGGTSNPLFPERASQGYALGCQVEAYRGQKVVHHGGNLVGYSSNVAVIPTLDAGLVVLTNRHGTALRDAIVPLVVDVLAGHEAGSWGERYHELETTTRQGLRAANAERSAASAGRPPVRPVEELVGTYTHPAYGELVLSEADGALAVAFHGLDDRVRIHQRDRDAYDLELVEFEVRAPLVFTTDGDDEVVGLTVALEPLVDPIPFAKAAPEVDPEVLASMVGSYAMGPVTIVVRQVGEELELSGPGLGTVRLVPRHGGGFGVPGQPLVRVTPRGDELVVHPSGVFTRVPAKEGAGADPSR